MATFQHQILIYCEQITHRLQYVLEWVFQEQMALDFKVTYDKEEWKSFEGLKINYSEKRIDKEDILIRPHRLIYEVGESVQQLNINRWKKSTVLFYNQPGALIPFDMFSAIFYLITRYEEYLPHKKDNHGRYAHSNAVGFQYSFLQQPVIDEWLFSFKNILEKKFRLLLPSQTFEFLPTYDIDIAWAYQNKTSKQQWAGAARDLSRLKFAWVLDRMIVNSSKKKDPYDAFQWLEDLQLFYKLHPIYFFLVGKNGSFDRNIPISHEAMQKLVLHTSYHAMIGLHPSYGSFGQVNTINKEKEIIENLIDKPITKSRQHYIKMTLPETYKQLIQVGITDDYSMGYPNFNGFRAGTSRPFFWYDLSTEQKTTLRVHPFAFMETTAINNYNGSKAEAFQEIERIIVALKNVNGKLVTIFHNNNLGNGREHKGWYKLYQKIIEMMPTPSK